MSDEKLERVLIVILVVSIALVVLLVVTSGVRL